MFKIRMLFLLALVVPFFITGCEKEKESVEPIIRPVRYVQVFNTGGSRLRVFSGTAQAGMESQLSFKVPGTVEKVAIKVGSKVQKGELLIQLDATDYKLQVQEAEASLSQASAQLRNARAKYDRTMSLYENNSASKNDLESARAGFESTEAAVQSIQKRLELARSQVSYTHLKAPISGSIAMVSVQQNENVAAGMPVAVITSSGEPEVRITVPEAIIGQVRAGSSASVTFSALNGEKFKAIVTEVGVASTGYVSTYPVIVKVSSSSDKIKPGMAAEVSFTIETTDSEEHIYVPSSAVGEDNEGRFVFTLEPLEEGYGVAKRKKVTIGELTSDGMIILEGLTEGDLIVTAGVSRITDGQKVKLI